MRTLILALLLSTAAMAAPPDPYAARVAKVLKATPLIDGHNDWPETLTGDAKEDRWTLDLRSGLEKRPRPYMTDIARLRQGMLGGQFWSVYVSANLPGFEQVKATLDQIDLVRQIVARYPETFELARTAADVRRIHKAGKIASLMGVEGGGQIDADFSVLRAYHELGAGYLTLAHFKTIDWADSATDAPTHGGLTPYGIAVVHELNRLGMLVDLAHVSEGTMRAALAASKAPVIFSHSSARALSDHPRNVSDEVLKLLAANGGVVMVNFYPAYDSEPLRLWNGEKAGAEAKYKALDIGQPDKAKADLADWVKAHPAPRVTLSLVADHIEHIAKVAGYDHVGLGSDFDGIESVPEGLEDVSKYPALLAELMKRGWSDQNVAKLAGENMLRVMAQAEQVAAGMKGEPAATGIEAVMDHIASPH